MRTSTTLLMAMLLSFCAVSAQSAQNATPSGRSAPCTQPESRQFDFWLGEWNLEWTLDGKAGKGKNTIQSVLNGCTILENFDGSPSMPLRGMSVSTFNAQTKRWQQTWVDNQGSYLDFVGEFKDGKMALWRKAVLEGKDILQRMVWYNITKDGLDWNWERSEDEGKTWKVLWKIRYARKRHQTGSPVLARYYFDRDGKDATGRNPDCQFRNVAFSENALYLNGKYDYSADPQAYRAVCSTPSLNYTAFTVALKFKADKFDFRRSTIVAGGASYRWLVINRTETGNLNIRLDNHQFQHEIKGARIDKGEWTVVACGVDVASRKLVVYLNGVKVADEKLPKGFKFEVADSRYPEIEKHWTFADYSNATTYFGLVDEMIIYERMLSDEEFVRIPLHP